MNESEDPEGLRVFYYLVQDLKALVFSLISLHFKVKASAIILPLTPTDPKPDQAYLGNTCSSRIGALGGASGGVQDRITQRIGCHHWGSYF